MRIFRQIFIFVFAIVAFVSCDEQPRPSAQLAVSGLSAGSSPNENGGHDTLLILNSRRLGDAVFSVYGPEIFAHPDFPDAGKNPQEWRGRVIASAATEKIYPFNSAENLAENLSAQSSLILILADGSAFAWTRDNLDLVEIIPPQNNLHFRSAAVVAGNFYAVAVDDADVISLYRWQEVADDSADKSTSTTASKISETRWEKIKTPLPFWREPLMLTMTGDGEKLLLAWRPGSRADGKIFSGWQAAEYDFARDADAENSDWDFLPSPPFVDADGLFAIASFADGVAMVQENNQRLQFAIFNHATQKWSLTALAAFPDDVKNSPPLNLAMTIADDGLTIARSSVHGIDCLRAPNFPDDPGRIVATAFGDSENSGGNRYLQIFAWIVFALLAMMILLRRWARRAVSESVTPNGENSSEHLFRRIKICGIASIFDRAIAMLIDGAICMLAPLAYVMTLADLSAAASSSTFFLWIGTMVVYSAVAEFFWRRTPGKAILKMRVCAIDGGAPTGRQILWRNLLRFVDFFPLSFGGFSLWYVVAAASVYLTKNSQRVGDLAAGTVVRYHLPIRRRQVILASGSPQRRELLRRYGLNFTVSPAGISEVLPAYAPPAEAAMRLSRDKALAVAAQGDRSALIIGADTLVAVDNQILGKPTDENEARAMLEFLANRKHHVFTGVTVIDQAQHVEISEVAITEVHWKTLDAADIEKYLAIGEWRGRAGGYAIQGEGAKLVSAVYGSVSNVIGLPLELLNEIIADLDAGGDNDANEEGDAA